MKDAKIFLNNIEELAKGKEKISGQSKEADELLHTAKLLMKQDYSHKSKVKESLKEKLLGQWGKRNQEEDMLTLEELDFVSAAGVPWTPDLEDRNKKKS